MRIILGITKQGDYLRYKKTIHKSINNKVYLMDEFVIVNADTPENKLMKSINGELLDIEYFKW